MTSCLVLLAVLATLFPSHSTELAAAQEAARRRVFTYFYYWYSPLTDDPQSVADHSELSLHFPEEQPADWSSLDWYRSQLLDMQAAGIDVVLPVYWGSQLYSTTQWSTEGLTPLVEALDELHFNGEADLKIGLFFDTYVLEGAQLTDPERNDWFASQIVEFFRRVPEQYRATEDGRPIVWLYVSNYANAFDESTFPTLDETLGAEIGARPYWVAEDSWGNVTWIDEEGVRHDDSERRMPFDAFYKWGAASQGALSVGDQPIPITAIGPGYDDTAILERGDERSIRSREDGCFYARSWRRAQDDGALWAVVETWNELYEGSGIAETAELGRAYIGATARYSAGFKRGERITLPYDCQHFVDEEIEDRSPWGPPPWVQPERKKRTLNSAQLREN